MKVAAQLGRGLRFTARPSQLGLQLECALQVAADEAAVRVRVRVRLKGYP